MVQPVQPTPSSATPLRQRMLEDMAMRGLRDGTQRDYIRFVRSFAAFLKRSPDTATPEDVRRFQVHQAVQRGNQGANSASIRMREALGW